MQPAADLRPTRWDEIKLSFKQGDLLGDICKTNSNIARLAKVKPNPLPTFALPTAAADNYNRIRNHARSLYAVFRQVFQVAPVCLCGPHDASLPLQRIAVDTALRGPFRLTVVFANPPLRNPSTWTWREMDFEPIEVQAANSVEGSVCSAEEGAEATDHSNERMKTTSNPTLLSPSKGKPKGIRRILPRGKTRSDAITSSSPPKEYVITS